MKSFLVILVLLPFFSLAQTISGTIKDNWGNLIPFSNILIKENSNPSSIVEFANARNGFYNIIVKKNYTEILVEVVSVGYDNQTYTIENSSKERTYHIDFILQKSKVTVLDEVVVVSEKKPYSIKKDTVTYNIEKYKDGTERKVQDVLKKLPGIEINEKSGEIKYKGKSVETVTLDGDNLFGYNYSLGTKNINIDMVEQVQAIENYSENPLLKGIENGDRVSLNLKLKKGKTDYSGNVDFGLGTNANLNLQNNSNANILGVSSKYKSFGILSYNNIGINHSPFDYFSSNPNIEQLKENDLTTQKVIPESLFSNIINDERANINNMFFSNYNSIFRINKRFSVKTNLYYLNDNIKFNQVSVNENSFENEFFITSDNYKTTKKPEFYRGDIELKYNASKNSLLEYKAKFNYEKINTFSSILANNLNTFETNLNSKNKFLNQKLIFTKKISNTKAIQTNIIHSFNDIPQSLILTQNNNLNSNNQNSNFKKNYFDGNLNFLGSNNSTKYSLTIGSAMEKTTYTSYSPQNISLSNNNSLIYTKNSIYNLASLNYLINKWSIIPSYSIKFLNQKLNDNYTYTTSDKKSILLNPSLLIKYKINDKSVINSKFSYSQNPFTEEYIFKNSVFTNNRIKTSNTPSLEIQKSKIFTINYYNNNLYKQFLLSFGVNYQMNNGGFFSDFIINEDEIIINNFYSNEKNDNLNFNLITEKFIPLISATLKLTSNYTKANYKNIINLSEIRDNSSNNISNEFSIKTSFNVKFNFENNLTYNYFSNKTEGGDEIKNTSLINSLKLKYKHSKNLFAIISCDYFLPNISNRQNDYLFLDISLAYKPENKNYEFNLIGKNLLNNKNFSQVQTTDFSKNTLQSNLLSKYIFINLTYKL